MSEYSEKSYLRNRFNIQPNPPVMNVQFQLILDPVAIYQTANIKNHFQSASLALVLHYTPRKFTQV